MKTKSHPAVMKKSLLIAGVLALMLGGQSHAVTSNHQHEQKGEQKNEQKAEQKGEQKGQDSKSSEQKADQKGDQKASQKGLKGLYRLKGLRHHTGDQKGATTKDKTLR